MKKRGLEAGGLSGSKSGKDVLAGKKTYEKVWMSG
jgi:hypothetical protein